MSTSAQDLLIPPEASKASVPIRRLLESDAPAGLVGPLGALAATHGFKAKAGAALLIPGEDHRLDGVLYGLGRERGAMALRGLAARLPPGDYRLEDEGTLTIADAVAFAVGAYRFDRYKPAEAPPARLIVPDPHVRAAAQIQADAHALARDLVNTPANDMGPEALHAAARRVADAQGAEVAAITGAALLSAGFPAVHAVGRAAAPDRAPRMVELNWGEAGDDAPVVAIVGKGVTFDTGGLDLKPSSGMRLMKKDMGGAAHALALGELLMREKIGARVVVLLPIVENAVSGDAMRPGDVLNTRSGLTVEVGNTDAEGRLILADALVRAAEFKPHLTICLATLTGAARVALGPEIVPFYTDDDMLAADLAAASAATQDPLWRMPLWDGYEPALDSDLADVKNDPDGWAQAGSLTAALFLRRFAPKTGAFVHFDLFCWNPRSKPGAPVGAEAQGLRALHRVVTARFPR